MNSMAQSGSARRFVVVADLDSQLYAAIPFADAFVEEGWDVQIIIPTFRAIPNCLLRRLQASYRLIEMGLEEATSSDLVLDADVVTVLLTGSAIKAFRESVKGATALRHHCPKLVTAFNGLVYEKFEEGLWWRLGYDVICLNGPRDLQAARSFLVGIPFGEQKFVLTGLSRGKIRREHKKQIADPTRQKTLVFAEQVRVPNTKKQRKWLFQRLNELAHASPRWQVLVRPRVSKSEKTFHRQILHPASGLPLFHRAPNLLVTDEPLPYLLARANVLLTVSSTAFFDAVANDVGAYALADFGIQNNIGTHLFFASNCMTNIGDLDSFDELPSKEIDETWLEWMGGSIQHAHRNLCQQFE